MKISITSHEQLLETINHTIAVTEDTRQNGEIVSVEQAKQLCSEHCEILGTLLIKVNHALGYALAEDIIAPMSLPTFSQSAMDGFAVKGSYDKGQVLTVLGQSKAGDKEKKAIAGGEAMKIFTGAPIPKGNVLAFDSF